MINWIPLAAGAVVQGVTSFIGARQARKAEKRALKEEKRARAEMKRLQDAYLGVSTTNPYSNMENTMEDLTVNTQAAQFQADEFARSQASVLDATRGAAGSGGIAALAQVLAQQGDINSQRVGASIAAQESANQRLAASEASRIQTQERQGEILSREMQREQLGTALGISQMETAAARQEAQLNRQAMWDSISNGVGNITSMATSYFGNKSS